MGLINLKFSAHFFVFLKFGVVGATTAVIYFLVMWIGHSLLNFTYIAAVSIAYFFSSLFHFLANRHFTFGAVDDRHERQLIKYLIMWTFNYLITIAVLKISVERFQFSPYLGVCVAVVFTMLTGYILSRYWVFNKRDLV